MMEQIPRGLELTEAVDRLRQQDALIYVPHPFDEVRKGTALMDNIKSIKADIIEVFNPRTINKNHNIKAFQYAEEKNIPKAVGSDSHTRFEIGKTYVVMEVNLTIGSQGYIRQPNKVRGNHIIWKTSTQKKNFFKT